ncbi:hypothetical protein [Bartonella tribocorum]|uniref:Hypothetical prophage protein n=1 Tax=Bartonella tribocorum (strain DSM 28219 / CCUG 45778 / CIP 105476 / IBS 506) TaxID=382640 RepID=A9ISX0_BART1|nr:hypothetical protein [Bartonella tribocorum]CAK01350.1 hypothetical prophage protein [Bartonella tribocorum CIP 105476]CDO48574.1 hypothetical protein BM1374166_00891 [Bartonella tribocorum]
MKIDTNFLCDLWMALFKFSNHRGIGDKNCNAIVEVMELIEKVLVLKLQNELPNITKILAMITNFGSSELPHSMDSLLRTYEPNFESPIRKVA